jgi:hypothetical protein
MMVAVVNIDVIRVNSIGYVIGRGQVLLFITQMSSDKKGMRWMAIRFDTSKCTYTMRDDNMHYSMQTPRAFLLIIIVCYCCSLCYVMIVIINPLFVDHFLVIITVTCPSTYEVSFHHLLSFDYQVGYYHHLLSMGVITSQWWPTKSTSSSSSVVGSNNSNNVMNGTVSSLPMNHFELAVRVTKSIDAMCISYFGSHIPPSLPQQRFASSSSSPHSSPMVSVGDRIKQLSHHHQSDGLAAPNELVAKLRYLVSSRNQLVHQHGIDTLNNYHHYATTWIQVRYQLHELLREWRYDDERYERRHPYDHNRKIKHTNGNGVEPITIQHIVIIIIIVITFIPLINHLYL